LTRCHLTRPSAHGVILMVAIRNFERAGNSERAGMMTANEAADQLGVKLGTLYAYVSRGWLKSYRRKVGRQALYRRADIEALRGVVSNERGRRGRSLPAASTWVTVAQPKSIDDGAPGVIVAESAVSSINESKLAYRGYPIEEILRRSLPAFVEWRATGRRGNRRAPCGDSWRADARLCRRSARGRR
jgi:excisionase family DNA binding protein